MIGFSEEELELLERYWDEIAGLDSKFYGCRPVEYSTTRLARMTIEEDGFQAFILIGGKGHGKSTYSLKTVAYYFMIYEGLNCGEAYQEALKRVAFTAKELLDKIEDYGDMIIWDDAGLHGSTYYWFVEGAQEYIITLANWYDVARTDVRVMLMSTPTKKKLPPVIRSDPEAILVRVRKVGSIVRPNGVRVKRSEAVGARNIESLYVDRTFREEIFTDRFIVYLPDPVYKYYNIIRNKYSEIAREAWRKAIEKLKDKLPLPQEF